MNMKTIMKKCLIFSIVAIAISACNVSGQKRDVKEPVTAVEAVPDTVKVINRTEEEWKKILTPEQYHVLRDKGTDRPFTGTYTYHKEKGKYACAACGYELFTSDMKFDSSCGWPSFDKEIAGGKIVKKEDTSFGMVRIEILCGRCGSHLGHLFDDGPTLTGKRYCVNSTSIDFKPTPKKK
jgi:methionine-R-sulfoxide reductase